MKWNLTSKHTTGLQMSFTYTNILVYIFLLLRLDEITETTNSWWLIL